MRSMKAVFEEEGEVEEEGSKRWTMRVLVGNSEEGGTSRSVSSCSG